MKIRTDVAAMLRDGLTNQQIAARAHVAHRTVAAARAALGLPKMRCGRRATTSPAEAFADRTRPVDGGHLEWTGTYLGTTPAVEFDGNRFTAGRLAFWVRYERYPVGLVLPDCDYPGCVAPDHVQDQPMREQLRTQYTAIFGRAA